MSKQVVNFFAIFDNLLTKFVKFVKLSTFSTSYSQLINRISTNLD